MPYLTILKIAAPVALFLLLVMHVKNDQALREEVGNLKKTNEGFAEAALEQQTRIDRLQEEKIARNAEIERMVLEERERTAAARQAAADNAIKAAAANADLAQAKFEILELMQANEDFEDWGYGEFPVDGWKLLHDVKKGRTNLEGMHTREDPGNSH